MDLKLAYLVRIWHGKSCMQQRNISLFSWKGKLRPFYMY